MGILQKEGEVTIQFIYKDQDFVLECEGGEQFYQKKCDKSLFEIAEGGHGLSSRNKA